MTRGHPAAYGVNVSPASTVSTVVSHSLPQLAQRPVFDDLAERLLKTTSPLQLAHCTPDDSGVISS